MIGLSPMERIGLPYHYGLTCWLMCDTPATGCAELSSPGAFGFTPWFDRSAGYYAILGMELDGDAIDSGALAVLFGDPAKKAPFTIRLKLPAGYRIPPHWHSNDEQLTILSGTFVLHMGDTMDAPGMTLTSGGFHFLPGKAHHAAETKGETIVQINGMGPFDIHYLNPADNPAKSAAATQK